MDINNFDFNHLGDSISHLVDDAINSQNFKELNKSISRTINQAVDGVNKTVENLNKSYGNIGRDNGHPYMANRSVPLQRQKSQGSPAVYNRSPGGQIAGSIKALTGFTLGASFGIAALVFIIMGILGHLNTVTAVILVFMCLFTLGGMALGFSGTKTLSRIKRFRQYLSIIGDKGYIELENLEKETGRSRKYLLTDLRDMMQRRMFRQAHFDQNESCFMLTDEVYRQYQEAMRTLEEKKKKERELSDAGITPEVMEVLSSSEDYLRKIHEANDALPGKIISQKLARLELVITRILEEVKKQPKKASELQKFMNYYLPTTWKLINAYLEFESQPLQTENIVNTKNEIEGTLDTINDAFEKLLDDLFQSQAWDISSDISVLQTMLAQEGLTKTDLTN